MCAKKEQKRYLKEKITTAIIKSSFKKQVGAEFTVARCDSVVQRTRTSKK